MILYDHHIHRALQNGDLILDPLLEPGQLQSSSLDLRVGDDFLIWNPALKAAATAHSVDLDNIHISEILIFTARFYMNAAAFVS
jgi:deoxycytidine triphosphate deaminase